MECSYVGQLGYIRNGERASAEQGMVRRVELREDLFEVLTVNIGIEYVVVFIWIDHPVLIYDLNIERLASLSGLIWYMRMRILFLLSFP